MGEQGPKGSPKSDSGLMLENLYQVVGHFLGNRLHEGGNTWWKLSFNRRIGIDIFPESKSD